MELSTGINFDAGRMLIGLELHGNGGPEYNLHVIQQEVVCCFFLYPHTHRRHEEHGILHPCLVFYVHQAHVLLYF